jgi:serine/threonine protein kinase
MSAHDPKDVEAGRAAMASGMDRATALRILERATAERCGFAEAARRLSLAGSQETRGLPPAGSTIAGYRLERLLGKGGMGAVYVGVNEAGMRRAIKVPLFDGELAAELRARFEREANTLGRVKPHPNVVRVHGAGQDGPYAYCVLELVEGESLAALAKKGPLEVERALDLTAQLARSLAHIHAHGIVHRDVKPENVLVRASDGSAVLMDFGLARDLADRERLTKTGVALGTPAYMAPEQVEGGKDVDLRADVYAAGVVLYELLAGERPHEGSQMELVKKILLDEPPPIAEKRPEVPRDVSTIIARAMAKDRLSRYATAELLAQDLERARKGEAILARPPTFVERLGRRLRRVSPRARLALAALPLAAAIGAAGIYALHERARRSEEQRVATEARAREVERAVEEGSRALVTARRQLLLSAIGGGTESS